MKLVAMLRVKNQILTINDCLTKLSDIVDEIVIVDNSSTDGTLQEYKKFPKIVTVKKTKRFHEGRDKILAHDLAKKRNPDWIIWVDGDEIFESNTTRDDFLKYLNNPKINLVKFRMYNFWFSKKRFRVDGFWQRYNSQPQRQMWRNTSNAYFRNLKFHNGGIMGIKSGTITSHIRIKHYGFIHKKQIRTKYKTYNKLKTDPMSKKTYSFSFENMKTWRFLESKNKNINYLFQLLYNIFYSLIEHKERFKDNLKVKIRLFKARH
jgi:glycosyltransferase involved in cell wall biosynthesis